MSTRIFDRLAYTETFASRGQKERKEEVVQRVERRRGFDSSRSSFFERLAKSETYASKRQKERKQKVKQEGRPLFAIDAEEQAPFPDLKAANSSFTMATASTFSSQASYSSRGSSRTRQSQSSNVFDRLASTNTKSSSRKDRRSENFDEENRGDSNNLTKEQALTRKFEGSTLITTKAYESPYTTSYANKTYNTRKFIRANHSVFVECGEI